MPDDQSPPIPLPATKPNPVRRTSAFHYEPAVLRVSTGCDPSTPISEIRQAPWDELSATERLRLLCDAVRSAGSSR